MCKITRRQIIDCFTNNLEIERTRMGLSQAQMAEKLNLSLTSYKNMISGVTNDIPFHVISLVQEITGKLFFELCDYVTPESKLISDFFRLPEYKKKLIRLMITFEAEFSEITNKPFCDKPEYQIPLYTLTGEFMDGMIYDSKNIEPLRIDGKLLTYDYPIDCGLKITSNHLHPVYYFGDILLICCEPPRDGDTGIFVCKDNGRAYIRKFRQTSPLQLIPICDYGKIIYINDKDPNDMRRWIFFGHVITKIR